MIGSAIFLQDETVTRTSMVPDQVRYYLQLAQQHQAALQQQQQQQPQAQAQQPQTQQIQIQTGMKSKQNKPSLRESIAGVFCPPPQPTA